MEAIKVRERPILFSGPMVRAILAGRKTQTRRVVKPQPRGDGITTINEAPGWWDVAILPGGFDNGGCMPIAEIKCPYGQPGDRLWVRETFAPNYFDTGGTAYRAEWRQYIDGICGEPAWKPSTHMPRRFSRITLEITDVRVERLQEISEADAIAEGAQCPGVPASLTDRGAFAKLWNKINGPFAWDDNPWVWVVAFRKSDQPDKT
jgi:hypothetical protein